MMRTEPAQVLKCTEDFPISPGWIQALRDEGLHLEEHTFATSATRSWKERVEDTRRSWQKELAFVQNAVNSASTPESC